MLLAKSCLLEFRIYLWLILLHCKKKKIFQSYCKFFFSLERQWLDLLSMALKKGVQLAWVELEKGWEQCTPFILGFLFYLKKMFKNVSSRALILHISCCRVPQTKKIIFMYMNPNVCPLSKYTEKVIRSNS